ncbi:peptidoglycan-binding protein [Leptolyngbya sp. GB1-A1]|uniref:peptidoglycan-binding protein n=1 Tax=Leptolyngbya sp. GB1-A1 TaxID=2933908 RepID=UPI00329771F6
MVMLKDITGCPSTTIADGLSRQIIAEMNNAVPSVLLDCSDLDISIDPKQFPLLQRPAKEALARAIAARGKRMVINSAYRTCAQQFLLRRRKELGSCGIAQAALPGNSLHESGLALDIPDVSGWKPFLEAQGWVHTGARLPGDPFHFEFRGRGIQIIGNVGVLGFQRLWNKNHLSDQIAEDGIYLQGRDTDKRLQISPAEGFGGVTPGTNRILRLSRPLMRGGDVRLVQTKLRQLSPPLLLDDNDVDGIYGSETEAAIRQFQTDQGILPIDGIVGPKTYEKLGIA